MWRSKAQALFVAAFIAALLLACRKKNAEDTSPESRVPSPARKVLYWYDPMKPEAHFDKPGKSPLMDMQLEPKNADESPAPTAPGQKKVLYWYDPMQPEGHYAHPGRPPFMPL